MVCRHQAISKLSVFTTFGQMENITYEINAEEELAEVAFVETALPAGAAVTHGANHVIALPRSHPSEGVKRRTCDFSGRLPEFHRNC